MLGHLLKLTPRGQGRGAGGLEAGRASELAVCVQALAAPSPRGLMGPTSAASPLASFLEPVPE